MAESVSALGEAGEEGSRGIEGAARLRWSEDPLGTGGGIEAGGCGATIHSERTPKITRSVSVSKSHRQETRTDLPLSEPAAEPKSTRENRNQPGQTNAQRPAKRLWKRRSLRELGNPFGIPTFPQPQQQQTFSGYISNGSTWIARVTFSNGLTRLAGRMEEPAHIVSRCGIVGSPQKKPRPTRLSQPRRLVVVSVRPSL